MIDPLDIELWKLKIGENPVAQVLQFTTGLERTKIVSRALDGSIYIQTVGEAGEYAKITLFSSLEEYKLINKAEASSELISVAYRGKKYKGFIKDAIDWQPVIPGEWYTSEIEFLIEEVEDL